MDGIASQLRWRKGVDAMRFAQSLTERLVLRRFFRAGIHQPTLGICRSHASSAKAGYGVLVMRGVKHCDGGHIIRPSQAPDPTPYTRNTKQSGSLSGKEVSASSRQGRLSDTDSPSRRECRQNFPSSERAIHGSRKPAKTPASSTLRKRSHADKS